MSQLRRQGYIFRMEYEAFLARYKMLSVHTWPHWTAGGSVDGVTCLLRDLPISANEYAFGRTKIFIRTNKTVRWFGLLLVKGMATFHFVALSAGNPRRIEKGANWWAGNSHSEDFQGLPKPPKVGQSPPVHHSNFQLLETLERQIKRQWAQNSKTRRVGDHCHSKVFQAVAGNWKPITTSMMILLVLLTILFLETSISNAVSAQLAFRIALVQGVASGSQTAEGDQCFVEEAVPQMEGKLLGFVPDWKVMRMQHFFRSVSDTGNVSTKLLGIVCGKRWLQASSLKIGKHLIQKGRPTLQLPYNSHFYCDAVSCTTTKKKGTSRPSSIIRKQLLSQ